MYTFVCFLDGNATEKMSRADYIWQLKQGRRERQGESHLRVSAIISALLQVVWLTKRTLTILELSWYERFGKGKKKLTSFSATSDIVRTIAERIISRRKFGMRGCTMKKARAKRAKLLFFIVKYVNLRRSCRRCYQRSLFRVLMLRISALFLRKDKGSALLSFREVSLKQHILLQ